MSSYQHERDDAGAGLPPFRCTQTPHCSGGQNLVILCGCVLAEGLKTVPLCLCETKFVATLDSGDSRASATCVCRSFRRSLLPVTISRTLHRGQRFALKSDGPGHSPSEIFNSRSVRAASCFCAPNSGRALAILAFPGELNRPRLQRRHDLPSAIYHRSSVLGGMRAHAHTVGHKTLGLGDADP